MKLKHLFVLSGGRGCVRRKHESSERLKFNTSYDEAEAEAEAEAAADEVGIHIPDRQLLFGREYTRAIMREDVLEKQAELMRFLRNHIEKQYKELRRLRRRVPSSQPEE
jgi:hypothetical protein